MGLYNSYYGLSTTVIDIKPINQGNVGKTMS